MNKEVFEDIEFVTPEEEQPVEETIKELRQRIEQLEILNDTTQFNLKIFEQIIAIISEFPVGKQIVNRAINRQKLTHLIDNVLPRRQASYRDINEDDTMPKGIKISFITREKLLLKNTERAITKRRRFELKAASNVSTLFDKINDFFYNKQSKKRKHLPPVMVAKT